MADPTWMLLLAAGVTSLVALTWLALSNDVHWEQVHGESAPPPQTAKLLRALGTLGLAASFGLCMAADHASMAVLVWVMLVPACTLAVAMTLAWRPALLRLLWAAGR